MRMQVTRHVNADEVECAAPSGAYVHGLHIEGAGWSMDDMSLQEQAPGQLQCAMPVVLFEPRLVDDVNASLRMYDAPTYKTSERHGVLSTTVRGRALSWRRRTSELLMSMELLVFALPLPTLLTRWQLRAIHETRCGLTLCSLACTADYSSYRATQRTLW